MFGVMISNPSRLLRLGMGITALCCSTAQAVHISTNGLGQALIFPYYNLRGDNDTLISIANHSSEIKALKVRVLEGENGRSVANFNLYMPANDVWTASLTDGVDGPVMRISDASCTVPYHFEDGGVVNLTLLDILQTPDSGRASIDRVREGYIEIIEMGTLDPNGMGAFAEFASSSEVEDCTALNEAWTGGTEGAIWVDDPQTDLLPPTGGLAGQSIFINVPGARAAAYQATALNRFFEPQPVLDQSLHTAPQNSAPGIDAASPAQSHVTVEGPMGPEVVLDLWDTGVEAVSAALMSDQIENQYATEAVIGGATEWVLTFPTKPAMTMPADGPMAPFTATFDEVPGGIGDGVACEAFGVDYFNRNSSVPVSVIPGTPPPRPPDFTFCYTVNVLSFNNSIEPETPLSHELDDTATDLLSSRLFVNVDPHDFAGFDSGFARVRFNGPGNRTDNIIHELVNQQSGRTYRGLPAVGFSEQSANNLTLNALFGAGQTHRQIPVLVNP